MANITICPTICVNGFTLCSLGHCAKDCAVFDRGEEFGGMALEHAWKVFAILPIKVLQKKFNATTPFEYFLHSQTFCLQVSNSILPMYIQGLHLNEDCILQSDMTLDSKNHPQWGVIGLFCCFPCSHAGYLVWEPRSKKLVFSTDVQFDEKFHSMGPRQHFTFKDTLPVVVKSSKPDFLDGILCFVPFLSTPRLECNTCCCGSSPENCGGCH
jgi:hypothetical protein